MNSDRLYMKFFLIYPKKFSNQFRKIFQSIRENFPLNTGKFPIQYWEISQLIQGKFPSQYREISQSAPPHSLGFGQFCLHMYRYTVYLLYLGVSLDECVDRSHPPSWSSSVHGGRSSVGRVSSHSHQPTYVHIQTLDKYNFFLRRQIDF